MKVTQNSNKYLFWNLDIVKWIVIVSLLLHCYVYLFIYLFKSNDDVVCASHQIHNVRNGIRATNFESGNKKFNRIAANIFAKSVASSHFDASKPRCAPAHSTDLCLRNVKLLSLVALLFCSFVFHLMFVQMTRSLYGLVGFSWAIPEICKK